MQTSIDYSKVTEIRLSYVTKVKASERAIGGLRDEASCWNSGRAEGKSTNGETYVPYFSLKNEQ